MIARFRFLASFAALCVFLACPGPAAAEMEDYPKAQLRGLDNSTARTSTFDIAVGETIQYGPLYIRLQSCRKAPPIETPESAAFVQVWDVPPGSDDSRWIFSGWMFASSPALSAMDHPVYDVWLLDCTGKAETEEVEDTEAVPEDTAPEDPSENDVPYD